MWVSSQDIKPYSKSHFVLAPLIGGPLAVGFLLLKNYRSTHDTKTGPFLVFISFFYMVSLVIIGLLLYQIFHVSYWCLTIPFFYFMVPYAGLLMFAKKAPFFGCNARRHQPSTGQVVLKSALCLSVNFALLLILMVSFPL